MNLRDRCEALVRELSGPCIEVGGRMADYCAGQDDVIKRIQDALDATEGEAGDAARYRWLRDKAACLDDKLPCVADGTPGDVRVLFGSGLDAAIDQAMKESKP